MATGDWRLVAASAQLSSAQLRSCCCLMLLPLAAINSCINPYDFIRFTLSPTRGRCTVHWTVGHESM